MIYAKRYITTGLMIILLAACNNSPTTIVNDPTPTSTPSNTATSTTTPTATPVIVSTLTPSLINQTRPTPTPSPTDEPTPTVPPTHTPVRTATPTPLPPPTSTSLPEATIEITETQKPETPPTSRTVRVGLHGRNDTQFEEADYQLIREARIETLKMMSLTNPAVFARIKEENPNIEFIVRLYDDRIGENSTHPTPQEFAERMIPIMRNLQPYVTKFEISNEPNHVHRYEGWGAEDTHAKNFNTWFLEVYGLLKAAHPWAQLGFPALATPDSYHRDRAWLEFTREAIEQADWLGVHCYWQTYPDRTTSMFDPDRGLCFTYYHNLFPGKPLEMTEFDNDNVIWDVPPLIPEEIAQEYVAYYQELFKYPYLRSASSFIMSSPDPRWDYFAWRTQADGLKPAVDEIGNMPRPPFIGE